jgi:hypothetical protein
MPCPHCSGSTCSACSSPPQACRSARIRTDPAGRRSTVASSATAVGSARADIHSRHSSAAVGGGLPGKNGRYATETAAWCIAAIVAASVQRWIANRPPSTGLRSRWQADPEVTGEVVARGRVPSCGRPKRGARRGRAAAPLLVRRRRRIQQRARRTHRKVGSYRQHQPLYRVLTR